MSKIHTIIDWIKGVSAFAPTVSIKNQVERGSSSIALITPLSKITFPVSGGVTGGTHPSVIHFPNGWSGYKYWMAYTPYPGTDIENPTIVASNDGATWVTPAGLVNPIDPTPATGYNSDTELVFAPGKMYCYWRWYTDAGTDNTLFRMESVNGSAWTNKTKINTPAGVDPLSPCILLDESGAWTMWIGTTRGGKMRKLTSVNGIDWSGMVDCTTSLDGSGFIWHPMVWREGGKYRCLAAFCDTTSVRVATLMSDLYYGASDDGIAWAFDTQPALARGEQNIHQYRVYRTCAVRAGNRYRLYVSGLGNASEQIYHADAVIRDNG